MLLFFDVDGTLVNGRNEVREKTAEAIRIARKNGHKCFINTGRCRAFLHDEALLGIGFDGIVSCCGTMVEYDGEVIFRRVVSEEDAIRTLESVLGHGFQPMLEGPEHLYVDMDNFEYDLYGNNIVEECKDRRLGIKDNWGRWVFQKLSCATPVPESEKQQCFDELSDIYDIIVHSDLVAEMVPKGFSKGTGIVKVCELLDWDIKDTMAFGDSLNDREMLEAAGTGVGMGGTRHDLSSFCDYITAPLEEDGIWKAMEHYGLI